jgi:hypothetical protein
MGFGSAADEDACVKLTSLDRRDEELENLLLDFVILAFI